MRQSTTKLVGAAFAVLTLIVPASALGRPLDTVNTDCVYKNAVSGKLGKKYHRQRQHAVKAGIDVGRDIVCDGFRNSHGHVRPATAAEVRVTMERIALALQPPATQSSTVSTGASSSAVTGATAPSANMAAIAQCESGGDPHAIGGGGAFRGKYQFTYQTWAAVGGSGDPAAAPEAEQDRRAAALMASSGSGNWPVCGQ